LRKDVFDSWLERVLFIMVVGEWSRVVHFMAARK
jgi:hypothetical protein